MMRSLMYLLAGLAVIAVAIAILVVSGTYDVAADVGHWSVTERLLSTLRDRSVAAHSRDLTVPPLDDPRAVADGAGEYAEMCTDCHLAPGEDTSEMRQGLYPRPPDLRRTRVEPREAFWTIKHGIKMSGMPAWGKSHDDATIWRIVAFLGRLPDMSPAEYRSLTARGEPSAEGHHHGHEAGHGEHEERD